MSIQPVRAWNAAIVSTACLWGAVSFGQTCVQKSNLWPYLASFGTENAHASFEANLELRRNCRDLAANAYAGAGVGLFDIQASLIEADTVLGLYDRKNLRLDAGITVLGYVVDSYSYEQLASAHWGDRVRFPIDLNDKQLVWVGPVPVTVQYGLQAEVGAGYDLSVAFLEADLKVEPFVKSTVYARAGVDVGFASVLATGRVKLLDDTLQSQVLLSFDQVDFDRLDISAHGVNHMSALDGAIEIYAGAKLGPFEKSHSQDLFRWNGYSRVDQVFDVAETVSLR